MSDHGMKVNNVLARILGRPAAEISPAAHVRDELGVDSTEMVEIVCALQKEFAISIKEGEEHKVETIADLHALVQQGLAANFGPSVRSA